MRESKRNRKVMRAIFFSFFLCFLSFTTASSVMATTWDEPWHEEVLKNADTFVKVKVTQNNGAQATAVLIKLLAGQQVPQQIELKGFSLLRVMSTSSMADEIHMPLKPGETYYLLLKRDEKTNSYSLPTPTSGYAQVVGTDVYATYRHSYHQAIVSIDIYEKTMTAIFMGAKNQPFDKKFVADFIKEQLGQPVANWKGEKDDELSKRFFLQHAALETFYHLGYGADLAMLIPFTKSDAYHVQISACRALGRINSAEAREMLMNYIEGKGSGFAKVMCVWALGRQNAREMIPRLETFLKSGQDERTGFGGNIMDPRVGTLFPDSVKWSIRQLLQQQWGRKVVPTPTG